MSIKILLNNIKRDIALVDGLLGSDHNCEVCDPVLSCEACEDTGIRSEATYDCEGNIDGYEDRKCVCAYDSAEEDWSGAGNEGRES